jgi:hypothetical protein
MAEPMANPKHAKLALKTAMIRNAFNLATNECVCLLAKAIFVFRFFGFVRVEEPVYRTG